jgi:hypothetical protein
MAVVLDMRAENSDEDLILNQWWHNFDNTAPQGFPERQQFMMQQGIDIRPLLDSYVSKKPRGDEQFKLRFKRDEDATLFLLRFS